MTERKVLRRWRHPAILIFILGGFLGAVLNLLTTLFLASRLPWAPSVNPLVAFFVGTFLNQAFHYVYYNVVYVNQEIRMKTSFAIHLFLSFWVSLGSAGLLWLFLGHGFS